MNKLTDDDNTKDEFKKWLDDSHPQTAASFILGTHEKGHRLVVGGFFFTGATWSEVWVKYIRSRAINVLGCSTLTDGISDLVKRLRGYADDIERIGTPKTPKRKTFGELKLGDKVYCLDKDCEVPYIETYQVKWASADRYHILSLGRLGTLDFTIYANPNKRAWNNKYFSDILDAEETLKEICAERVADLNKVIEGC